MNPPLQSEDPVQGSSIPGGSGDVLQSRRAGFWYFERFFVVFVLLYFAGGLNFFFQQGEQTAQDPPSSSQRLLMAQPRASNAPDPTEKNPTKLMAQLFIYLVTGIFIIRDRGKFFQIVRQHKLLIALLALAAVSSLWSEVAGFTFRRSLVLSASTILGVYLGMRFTMRDLIKMLCAAGAIAAASSLIVIWLRPDFGISGGATAGDWQGIFGQKNTLGGFMALSTIAFVFSWLDEKEFRKLYAAGAVLCFGLLILSKDTTATLLTPLLLATIPVFNYARKHSLRAIFGVSIVSGIIMAAVVFVLFFDVNQALSLLDKDISLSGRTDIWPLVWHKFLAHPFLGYGYSAFWLGQNGRQSAYIWSILHWPVPHSHNGFLDVLADLGLAGFTLFWLGYVMCFRQALKCARLSKSLIGLFPLVYFSFVIVFNISEGSILKQESLIWVLYAATWVLTTRWLQLVVSALGQPTTAKRLAESRGGLWQPAHAG